MKIIPTVATYNILIYAFCNKLKIRMATEVFHEMVKRGCVPDVFTYSVLVDGFCKTGNIDYSYDFLIEMLNKELIPSTITFGRVINCLCKSYRVQEAVGIVHTMVNKGLVPDVVESIFEVDKKEVAAPKILLEDMLMKGLVTYQAYDLLFRGIRERKYRSNLKC